MWPGFDSRSRRHMWVEFVVGSRSCSEGFSPGTPVFLPPQKPTFPNSSSTRNARTPLNELRELFGASWVNKLHFFYLEPKILGTFRFEYEYDFSNLVRLL